MKVLLFGSIKENIKQGRIEPLKKIKDLAELKSWLENEYHFLKTQPYAIAVNTRIQEDMNTPLREQDEVALLPPFSGG